jgi:quercetin dioxygenase-like cupin family protein
MNTSIKNYVVRTQQAEWKPLKEEGVNTKGIYSKILRYDEAQKRPTSFLLKFEAGSSYPYHNHPAGEESIVLEGEAYSNEAKLMKCDYLYTPPGSKHSVKTDTGCIIMFIVPEEVEIVNNSN